MLPRVSALSDTERAWSVLRDGRLAPSARVALPVLSGSMRPLLPVDASLEIAGAGASDLASGDFVVFRNGGALSAHRVLLVLRLPGPASSARRATPCRAAPGSTGGAWSAWPRP